MISPHTAPGTKVVCVEDKPNLAYCRGFIPNDNNMFGLTKGGTYTVREIIKTRWAQDGFGVVLSEIQRGDALCPGFALARFRYLHLPRSLTDLLETAPTRAPSELEPTQ